MGMVFDDTDEGWIRTAQLLQKRIETLEDALRRVVADVNEYERVNNLAPNHGRTECWDSVAHAKAVLAQ